MIKRKSSVVLKSVVLKSVETLHPIEKQVTPPKNKPKIAKKITKETEQSLQLSKFVTSLGVKSKLELYSCGELVYLNSDILLPILSVEINWFLKNSETPLHYISINKQIYINRYGMTKLIAQSKETVSLRLQDYLYELFYRVETDKTVSRDDLSTRAALMELTTELDLYRTIENNNKLEIESVNDSYKTLQCDYAILNGSHIKLQEQFDTLETELSEINTELEQYTIIANVLAKYVRVKSKNPPKEAYYDGLDIDEEETDETALINNAIDAKISMKKLINTAIKDKATKHKSTASKGVAAYSKTSVFVLRSVDIVSTCANIDIYNWELSDVIPSEQFIEESTMFISDDSNKPQDDFILYATVGVSREKKDAMSMFLNMIDGRTDELTINKLLDL